MTAQLDMFQNAMGTVQAAQPATILREVEHKADPAMLARARLLALDHLLLHGPTSSEEITDSLKERGVSFPGGDRTFGCVYHKLSRDGLIVKHDFCLRKKGHSTQGGIVWRLAAGESLATGATDATEKQLQDRRVTLRPLREAS